MKFNRPLFLLIPLAVVLLATQLFAGITGTNVISLATYATGTNYGNQYFPPQSFSITPQSITIYHSATNSLSVTTNYFETSFDGGTTWTITASYVTGTNSQTEIWNPSTASLVATNRIRQLNGTNQSIYIFANWNQ